MAIKVNKTEYENNSYLILYQNLNLTQLSLIFVITLGINYTLKNGSIVNRR